MDAFQLAQELYEIGNRAWQKTHDAVTEELDFFDGNHFAEDGDEHEKNRYRIEVKGQELYNVVRHKAARVVASPRRVEAHPIDRNADPVDAELATALVAWETGNPLKCFDDYCAIVVTGAIAARYWLLAIDYEPLIGPWGEIVYRPLDPRNTGWEPSFHTPHDLACGWFYEERHPTLAWVRSQKEWLHVDEVRPDSDTRPSTDGKSEEFPADTGAEKKVHLIFMWLKHDRTTIDVDVAQRDLPEEQQYIRCTSCDWKGDPGAGLTTSVNCPRCGMPTEKVVRIAETETRRRFPNGHRLIVIAPESGVKDALYDGPWPVDELLLKRNPKDGGLRSFPVMVVSDYLHPAKPVGPSDTLLNWGGQLMLDLLMTTAGQRVLEYRNYYLMPEVGVSDAMGRRFEFRDDQMNTMFYKETLNPAMVQVLAGSSLDPGWNAYWRATRETVLSRQGIGDLGLGPQDSKDIASSTVQQLTELGEIPTEDLKRRYHRELGRVYGLIWDFIRATYSPARIARLNLPEIGDAVVHVLGDELPNYDFIISDGDALLSYDKARAEAMAMMIQAAQLPPLAAWELMAEVQHISPSLVKRVRRAIEQAKAEQQKQMAEQMAAQQQQGAGEQQARSQELQLKAAESEAKLGLMRDEQAGKMALRTREVGHKMYLNELKLKMKAKAGGLAANSTEGGHGARTPRGAKGPPARQESSARGR